MNYIDEENIDWNYVDISHKEKKQDLKFPIALNLSDLMSIDLALEDLTITLEKEENKLSKDDREKNNCGSIER